MKCGLTVKAIMMIAKNLGLSLSSIYRSLRMDNKHILEDTESSVINWDRLDVVCARIVKSASIVMVTIACWYGVYWLLAKTFWGV